MTRKELLAIDWQSRPFVTGTQLAEMGPATQAWFRGQPNVWRSDPCGDVLRNCAHPDNFDFWMRDVIGEACARAGIAPPRGWIPGEAPRDADPHGRILEL